MTAVESLQTQQFKKSVKFRTRRMTTKQIGRMKSLDFAPKTMDEVTSEDVGRTHDDYFMTPQELSNDIKTRGVKNPLGASFTYKGGASIKNGHHRFVASKMAGVKKLDVSAESDDMQQIIHSLAHYTPPGQPHSYKGYAYPAGKALPQHRKVEEPGNRYGDFRDSAYSFSGAI